MAARLVAPDEDGQIKHRAVFKEVLGSVCSQKCAKADKGNAVLSAERPVGKVGEHEICHGMRDALFGQVRTEASKDGLAVFVCGEASGDGCNKRVLTAVHVAEQSVLLIRLGEICKINVEHVFYVVVLHEEAPAADGSGSTPEVQKKLSCKGDFVQNQRKGNHPLVGHGCAVNLCPKIDKLVLDIASPVSSGAVDGPAHGLATETDDQVEQHSESTMDENRGFHVTFGGDSSLQPKNLVIFSLSCLRRL